MGGVNEPVHDRIRNGLLGDYIIPFLVGKLRCNDGCLLSDSVFEYFQEHEAGFVVEDLESEVVYDEDVLFLYLVHFFDVRAVRSGDAEQCEELLGVPVEDFLSFQT